MNKSILLAALAVIATAPVMAGTPRLDAREANQRARIHQGVQTGELTRPEARRLKVGEARLNYNEARAKADGVVTPAERARLQNEANRESARIHQQKHDAQDRN
jgi:GNAT superfamily N-acetyltransferase